MRLALVIAFTLASVALYARTLDGWFLSDDATIALVVPDGSHVSWSHVRRTFVTDWLGGSHVGYYRPLVIVTQALDAAVWDLNPIGYHLTNAALHGVTGYFLFVLARSFGLTPLASGLAGLLFVAHPLHSESVAWISGRTDVLATMLMIATLVVHRKRRPGDARPAYWAVILAALALLSKESAISLPLVVVAMDLVVPLSWMRKRTAAAPMWAAYACVTVGYLGLRSIAIGGADARGHGEYIAGWSNPDIFEHVTGGLFLLLTPFSRTLIDPSAEVAWLCASGVVWAGVGMLLVRGALKRTLRWDVLGFCGLAFVATVAPFLHMLPDGEDLVSSRIYYTATAWIALLMGTAAHAIAPRWAAAGLLPALTVSSLMLHVNQRAWVEAGAIAREVHDRYEETFGGAGEAIIDLPRVHDAAYLALDDATLTEPPFVRGPPKLEAVAAKRAIYDPQRRTLRIVDDPNHEAPEGR